MTFQVEKFTSGELLPKGYTEWRKNIIELIEKAKYQTSLRVNADLLSLYWRIGCDILEKQKREGWGAQVVNQLSRDLMQRFPDDRGYSTRNLREMKRFAESYPDFPFVQVSLAKLQGKTIWQAALAKLKSHDGFIQHNLSASLSTKRRNSLLMWHQPCRKLMKSKTSWRRTKYDKVK